jgi:Ran GTPase-activating protein (RanGAP) involved in mRNA processing and transport
MEEQMHQQQEELEQASL